MGLRVRVAENVAKPGLGIANTMGRTLSLPAGDGP